MPDPMITLTTDFGEDSPYVAAMKGVILSVNPAARILDLSHQIPPQNVRYTAFFLATAIPYYPPSPNILHVVVVDPGVGTERALLLVEVAGRRLLVPDNGCWTTLERSASQPPAVYRLTEPQFWRQPVSATFHGRDILAPVAGHLSLGVALQQLAIRVSSWVKLPEQPFQREPGRLSGAVEFIDHFGNLITNIPGEAFLELARNPVIITVADQEVSRHTRSYGMESPGTLLALVSSSGWLEIAVNQGSAAVHLQAEVGTPVTIKVREG